TVEPGDHVEVTGEVDEFAGQTQVVSSEAGTVELTEPAGAVTAYAGEWPATDAAKESLEAMLFSPQGDFTVTNTYSTNQYGEVGLAVGDKPLVQPTEVADAQDEAAIAAVKADNAARAITLDDGSSTDYTRNSALTPAYVSNEHPVRVGAAVEFTEDVILTQGGSPSAPTYRFQPLETVDGEDFPATSPATFENTRTEAPDAAQVAADGTPDVTVASFNVLNYFTTLGDADDDNVGDGGCTSYNDRDGDGNNVRGGCDQRGAWDPEDLERQQEKIVAAINALDADVVGLMEIENSAALGEAVDEATESLVAALNADAGAGTWAANPSSSELPAASEQDVITNAIIYKPAAVERVGEARALGDQSAGGQAFGNAREPIGQVFAPVEGGEEFLFVVNHFKSKGSGTDDGTGQGNANPDRIAQATALEAWVPTVQDETGTEAVLLVGDFNSYSMEDPMQVLYDGGYTNVQEISPVEEWSYSFSGLSGSLDHVLANDAALELATGTDIWNINSGESVAMEYSRFNYHGTDFHEAGPFRSSDHDPVVLGLDLVADEPELLDADIAVKVAPKRPRADRHRATFKIEVSADGATPTGEVVVDLPGKRDLVGELNAAGKVVLKMTKPFGSAGEKTVVVRYAGDELVAASEETTTLVVRKAKKVKKNK
ncbi:ExeM/NucH family extracellular endonuclease, partial [Nocardioides salarius]|uniref:ExeM/NucH family extracellular endonuclease n=1 Tax=Nocardioides salarius TaxID=374513 RepID=UPI0030F699C9